MTVQVSLRPITAENWRAVVRLKPLPEQEAFVASNAYSIVQASFEGGEARAVYAQEQPVGFVWYTYDETERMASINRLMIAADQQQRGYGRAALHAILERLRALPTIEWADISFVPENAAARRLYTSIGFRDTGEIDDGEIVFRLKLRG